MGTLIFFWILFSVLVGVIGADRSIGFWATFFISLLLSPIIGLIVAIVSKSKVEIQKEIHLSKKLMEGAHNNNISKADELKKWDDLFKAGTITKEEFETQKSKLLTTKL